MSLLILADSSRVYLSTNPWKITATFQAISSSREEYVALVEKLKQIGPAEGKGNERRSKVELQHIALVKALEDRLPAIDAEIAVSQISPLFSVTSRLPACGPRET